MNHLATVVRHLAARRSLFLVCLIAVSLVLSACQRKPEDLEVWRNAKGGVEKLTEWATSPDEPMDVRVRAVEILIEDGHANKLPGLLDRVEDEGDRVKIASGAVATIEKMWAKQDIPKLTEEMKEGGDFEVGDSEAVKAKDAAYMIHPYVDEGARKKIETILAAWVSEDHELRNQLGNSTIGQLLPRAGADGIKGTLKWIEETPRPGTVARAIREHADDDAQKAIAETIKARAEKDHPELSDELVVAVLETEHDAMIPYLQQAIMDPETEPGFIDSSMRLLTKIQGERAASFFSRLIADKAGQLRWVAAGQIITIRGKAGFLNIALALPLEADTYAVPDADSFDADSKYVCNLLKTELAGQGVDNYSDVLKRALENNRWPAQVLGLRCAHIAGAADVLPAVEALRSSRQSIPGWGEAKTIGQLADEVAGDLAKLAKQ